MKYTKDQISEIFKTYKKRKIPRFQKNRGEIKKSLTRYVLEDLYYVQNKSLQDIADQYNCTRPMVKYLMDEYGLETRRRGQARVLAIKKGKFENFQHHDINEDFFSNWTPQMAWVLGLIFTDGNFFGKGTNWRVNISSVDLDLLEKVKVHLNSTLKIRKLTQSYDKSKHIYRLEFYREKMRDDLVKLGLLQNKSLIMKFPDIPEKHVRHFIRGCWDGDGSVFISSGKLLASFVSGSKEFIERLNTELYLLGIVRSKKEKKYGSFFKVPLSIHKSKRSRCYSIKVQTQENMVKLFHHFYDGVDESMYLERKYNIFVKGLLLDEKDKNNLNPQRVLVVQCVFLSWDTDNLPSPRNLGD